MRDGAIATVALRNVRKLNALTVAMWQSLGRAVNALSADDAVRCVVLRGAGTKAFAAGADIAEFARVRDSAEQGRVYHREYVGGALEAIAACRHRKPKRARTSITLRPRITASGTKRS